MPRLTTAEIATEAGFRFTAIGSATGIGVLVSSSGGSFVGKKRSWTFSKRSAKIDFSSKALPKKESSSWPVSAGWEANLPLREPEFAPASTSGGLSRSFAIVSAGSHIPRFCCVSPSRGRAGSQCRKTTHPDIMRDRRPLCLAHAPFLSRCSQLRFRSAQALEHKNPEIVSLHNRRYVRRVVTGFSFRSRLH